MTSEDLPRRKKIRLEGYDYSANGLYFVTICVTEKYQVLWENVGANSSPVFFYPYNVQVRKLRVQTSKPQQAEQDMMCHVRCSRYPQVCQ